MPQPMQVGRQLRQLAQESRLSGAAEHLRGLALAVEGVDRDPWLDVRLHQALDPRLVVQGQAMESGGARLLHTAPAMVVFLPIMVTWYGLYRATRAFREAVAVDAAVARRSFLELWNTGMVGQLPSAWRFERVALYDVLAVAVLCVAIGAEGIGRRTAQAREEAAVADLVARLSAALLDADLVLAPHRLAAPARFSTELGNAATELGGLVQRAVSAAELLKDAARQVGSLSDRIRTIDEHALHLRDTAQTQAQALTSALGSAERTMEGRLERAMASVHASLSRLQDHAQRTSHGQDQVLAVVSAVADRVDAGRPVRPVEHPAGTIDVTGPLDAGLPPPQARRHRARRAAYDDDSAGRVQ